MLKFISEFSLNSENKINDTRVLQVILNDKSDIEFAGITIYYEFNRILGNVKNKEEIKGILEPKELNNGEKSDYINELKELKSLMDSGILTKEEFQTKKREILERSKELYKKT